MFQDTQQSSCLGIIETSCRVFSFSSHSEWRLFTYTLYFVCPVNKSHKVYKTGWASRPQSLTCQLSTKNAS